MEYKENKANGGGGIIIRSRENKNLVHEKGSHHGPSMAYSINTRESCLPSADTLSTGGCSNQIIIRQRWKDGGQRS